MVVVGLGGQDGFFEGGGGLEGGNAGRTGLLDCVLLVANEEVDEGLGGMEMDLGLR